MQNRVMNFKVLIMFIELCELFVCLIAPIFAIIQQYLFTKKDCSLRKNTLRLQSKGVNICLVCNVLDLQQLKNYFHVQVIERSCHINKKYMTLTD